MEVMRDETIILLELFIWCKSATKIVFYILNFLLKIEKLVLLQDLDYLEDMETSLDVEKLLKNLEKSWNFEKITWNLKSPLF